MKVLITGSREMVPGMSEKIREVIRWCATEQYHVVVGDASGVDAEVRRWCQEWSVPCQVLGAYGRFREPRVGGELARCDFADYLARDRHMASEADLTVALWNGTSRGTRYTGKYAESLGKKVYWRIFL